MLRRRLSLLVALLPFAACGGTDPDPEPEVRDLSFWSLAIPSQVASGVPFELDVSFLVGPNGCWNLQSLEVSVEEDRIRIHGTAVDPKTPGVACTQALVYGRELLQVGPLESGRYVVEAGVLTDTLDVVAGPTRSLDRFTIAERLRGDTNGCDTAGTSRIWVGIGDLPQGMEAGVTYLVRGDIVPANDCAHTQDGFDFVIRAREVVPLD